LPESLIQPDGPADAREALYQRLIMERARTPLHAGLVDPADGTGCGNNPFCGDRTQVTVSRAVDRRVALVRHETRGCALCAASADLMAESVAGLDDAQVIELSSRFAGMLRDGPGGGGDLGLLCAFESLHEFRSRRRCASLPWEALLQALGIDGTAAERTG